MPGQGLLTTPESLALLRRRRFCALRLRPKQAWSDSLGTKNPERLLGAFWGWRSEADSNRCSSFCRAEPSHSAIGPFPQVKITVGLRIYESGFRKVSFFGDKFREDAYNAGDERVMGWVSFVA